MPAVTNRLRKVAARALLLTACLAVSSCASAHQARSAPLDAQFSHRVSFEIGHTEAADGNAITIEEMWGTRPTIEVGGSYIVKGTYKLTAADEGDLVFWETAKGWHNSGPNMDTQVMHVRQGEGKFALLHDMPGPGYFHLVLHAGKGSERTTVADVYFGRGETLLKARSR